ncbi:MAG: NrsF family protein [Proteobacteria bacterium]|nr:NrsF family protein [Pseudomonadota bacterium]
MKTDRLIDALVADRAAPSRPIATALAGALALGGLVSLVVFAIELGVRKDLGAALATWRFDLKIVLVAFAVVLAFGACRALANPAAGPRALRRLLPLLALAAGLVAVELVVSPAASWSTRLVGSNARFCLTFIPILSLAPLAAALLVLRRGAPTSPTLAGAAAGLLAAASGALLYAFHCFDDSPLFVMTWYSLAAVPIVALGALAGRRLLRW